MLEPRQAAPEFELEDMDGERHALSGLVAEGPIVLAFFKVSCPVCRFAFPFLERMASGSSGKTVRFYGVSQDDESTTRQFVEELEIRFPTLLDQDDEGYPASNAYEIRTVPSVYVIESDGTISAAFAGFEKVALEELGQRVGTPPFKEGENVPAFQPG